MSDTLRGPNHYNNKVITKTKILNILYYAKC